MKKRFLLFIFILSGQLCLLQAQDRVPDREKYDWQGFDKSSVVPKDSIDYDLLQGNWVAFQGSHISEYKVAWATKDKPVSLQIKGNKYRNTLSGDFYPFLLDKNLIVFQGKDNQSDSAYINLITENELTIGFKRGIDYETYRYKK